MPFTLSALISSAPTYRFPHRSPLPSRNRPELNFPAGGQTQDGRTIPADRLQASLSDPVLVAAEQHLCDQIGRQDGGARTTPKLGTVVFHLNHRSFSQSNVEIEARQAVNPSTVASHFQATSLDHYWISDPQGVAGHSLSSASDDSRDIFEVMSIPREIGTSSGDAYCAPTQNSRCPDLAPLASETLKQELYTRGYLKSHASRPANLVPRNPITSLVSGSRSVFPKVLGRRQGRKVAKGLRTEQDPAEHPCRPDAQFPEKHLAASLCCATLRIPLATNLGSPRVDTNAPASKSLDTHKFSYTAFATPPSSPSVVLDVETFKEGANLDDSKHAV